MDNNESKSRVRHCSCPITKLLPFTRGGAGKRPEKTLRVAADFLMDNSRVTGFQDQIATYKDMIPTHGPTGEFGR